MMNRQEFEETLVDPCCMDFWMYKSKDEVVELLGTDVGNMVGFDQRNPHHCFDLFSHSLKTVESIRMRTQEMPATEQFILLCSAFFHDIGKIACAKEKDGRLVFYGHAIKSAEIARTILAQLGCSPMESEAICFLIAHHDDFISFVTPQEFQKTHNRHYIVISEHNIIQHICATETVLANSADWYNRNLWKKLCILCQADVDSQAASVVFRGQVVTSRKLKQAKLAMIQSIIMQMQ